VTTDRTVTIAGVDRLHAQFNQRLLRPRRGRLPLRQPVDRRRRHHALRGRTVHDVRPARLCRAGGGARQATDAALTTASAELKWMNGWSAAGTFEGEFSDVTCSYAGKGVVRYTW